MGQIGEMLAAPGRLGQLYARRLLEGIPHRDAARFARPGGVEVRSNHPVFVLGHLALYPPRIMEQLGRPVGASAVPAGYEALFKAGVDCQDDPDGTIYPALPQLMQHFFASYAVALDALSGAEDAALLAPNPAEGRMRELFPTLGGALAFYVAAHVFSHLGQVSAWRRAIGLPAA